MAISIAAIIQGLPVLQLAQDDSFVLLQGLVEIKAVKAVAEVIRMAMST